MMKLSWPVLLSFLLPLAACGGSSSPPPQAAPLPPAAEDGAGEATAAEAPAEGAAAPATSSNEALVARGAEVYGANCAKCHGDAGQGKDKAPPVVGQGALPLDPRPGSKRKVQFRTAADVLAWFSANMPPTDPGSLPAEDYLAILAFDLKANGVDLGTEPLTAERAATIVLHE